MSQEDLTPVEYDPELPYDDYFRRPILKPLPQEIVDSELMEQFIEFNATPEEERERLIKEGKEDMLFEEVQLEKEDLDSYRRYVIEICVDDQWGYIESDDNVYTQTEANQIVATYISQGYNPNHLRVREI